MGEAKRRGNKEQRTKQALQEFIPTPISKIKEEMNIPIDAVLLGHVIHLPESDEFLASYEEREVMNLTAWTKTPSSAKCFPDFHKAVSILKELERPNRETLLCLLFEDDKGFYLAYSL